VLFRRLKKKKKEITSKIRMLSFVKIKSVLVNRFCVWISLSLIVVVVVVVFVLHHPFFPCRGSQGRSMVTLRPHCAVLALFVLVTLALTIEGHSSSSSSEPCQWLCQKWSRKYSRKCFTDTDKRICRVLQRKMEALGCVTSE